MVAVILTACGQASQGVTSADCVRYAGIAVSVAGALAVVPTVASALPRLLVRYIRNTPGRVSGSLSALAGLLAQLVRPTGRTSRIAVGDRAQATDTVSVERRFEFRGDRAQLLTQLLEQAQYLLDRYGELLDRDNELQASLDEAERRADQRHRELLERMEQQERRDVEINTRALPLVAIGIIIVSLPDELANWLWLAVVAIVTSGGFFVLGMYWIWRYGRAAAAGHSIAEA